MPRHPRRLEVRLPRYKFPRNAWRRAIHRAASKKTKGTNIRYLSSHRLEINVWLYLKKAHLTMSDLDNRLKDVLDATWVTKADLCQGVPAGKVAVCN